MLRTIASEEGYTTAANFNDRARAAGLATQTDVSTAVSAEAVNRATAISSATSGLVRNDDFTTKANAFISGLGFVKEDDLNTKIDSRTSALGLIRGSDVDSKITVATSSLATKTELATEKTAREAAIATEATNRATAITAEATARASAITSATSGLVRSDNFDSLLGTKAAQLGFAKTTDVNTAIADTEARVNKATNQKLGTAFGLTVNGDADVDMTALQTQLQNFAGSTLLTANIISDGTEGNQTLTQWLNNKQTIENTNFTDIANRLTQLANDITDIKNKLNTHAANANAHSTTSGGLFDNVTGYDGPIYHPIGGFTPNISFNDKNTSNNP